MNQADIAAGLDIPTNRQMINNTQMPKYKEVQVKGKTIKLKYCFTVRICELDLFFVFLLAFFKIIQFVSSASCIGHQDHLIVAYAITALVSSSYLLAFKLLKVETTGLKRAYREKCKPNTVC